ncbi:MAG: DUF5069 domain-containing protein [Opitutaceae bacterium]
MINFSTPDLTAHPPRSVRVRLGGFAHLPRLLDKARATAAGKAGAYKYDCPMDKNFFAFTGLNADAFLAEARKGGTDSEMLAWVRAHCRRLPAEIHAWSAWLEQSGPGGSAGHEWMAQTIKAVAADRDDVRSFADLLDLDDYNSFGGKG